MNTQTLTIKKEVVVIFIALISVAVGAPLLFKQQFITGPIVNATLILGTVLLSSREGILIGLLPSTIALGAGIISPVLAPMIPFVILGNAILVLTFTYLSKVNYWLGAIAGSALKFAFLYFTSTLVIKLVVNQQVAPAIAQTMNWPQLVTALAGSIIAFAILKVVKKKPVTN